MSTHYAVSKRLHRSTALQIGAVLVFWGLGTALAVASGVPLPGLYPPNAETKARYEASKK